MQVTPGQRFVFVTGTPANLRHGSGTWAGIAALRQALRDLGHEVALIAPAQANPSLIGRLLFNLRARGTPIPEGAIVVGFDLDGLFLGAPIASIKGVISEEMQFERGATRLRLWLASRLERRRVRRAARVLTTSRYAAAALERRYGVAAESLRIVPELLNVAAWQRALSQTPQPANSAPVILCVAHLYPRKDIPTLLQALALLPDQVRLHVVGEGPEAGRLRRLAAQLRVESRVEFLGHIARPDLLREYRGATVFCLPSRQEGFGIVLLEAMASGLPIVAARATAIPEVVPEPDCGLLFPPGDARLLAGQVLKLLDDAALRGLMARAAQRHVLRYDAARIAPAFLAAITGAAPSAPLRPPPKPAPPNRPGRSPSARFSIGP
ncbi:MAG: glycosyltransferase family 4 protein [Terriglobales bacterium]